MILAAQHIRDRRTLVTPFVERSVSHGMTYGLSPAGYDVRCAEQVTIPPGAFRLASTVESFIMPDDLIAFVHDKSSWARKGLAVQNTVVESGWRGFLTLELTNHGDTWIGIPCGAPIAQIVIHTLTAPTDQPYDGRYQDQEAGPQKAREIK